MGLDILGEIIKRSGERFPRFQQRLDEARCVARWEEVVGKAIARNARALRVKDKILFVTVEHPIWRTELHHRKREILARMNQSEEHGPLKDIVFLEPRKEFTQRSFSKLGKRQKR